jgi:hypothetical protein
MKLPEEFRSKLVEAHRECAGIIKASDHVAEPLETALLVERHRWFWRPESVRFVLVAESHVYTGENEIKAEIDPSKLPREAPEGVPLSFVRLVYCLGYGNSDILKEGEKVGHNSGTSQYVSLFARCLGLGTKPRGMRKLDWKTMVLKAAKMKGLWLLDASLHACYLGRRERLPPEIVRSVVTVFWSKYVKAIIDDLPIDREQIWTVGKGLHETLRALDARINAGSWIYQPNAHFKNREHYMEKTQRLAKLEKACAEVFTHPRESET